MKTAGVKERVLETAARLFYEQGYQATGINQIIEEAAIAKASLYQHFASKELVLNAYLQNHKINWYNNLLAYTEQMEAGREKLLGLFDYRKQTLENRHYKGCAFSRMVYELPDINEEALAIIQGHKLAIKGFLKQQLYVMKTTFGKDDLNEFTEMLFNLLEGAILQGTILRSSKPMEETRRMIVKLLDKI
ncbi:transcriptional regulator, TetR family [Chitinophaga costaii]|uniref:Transcriptional regulator, TetR family n=1 Tax=Chitinophaga costaii TaxID=1335309 RepID=A0A1C4EZH6_9BACT|nr:TetR/AcrR family transcriptional regulator [Chitinophaga costaii]PUZ21518.1 TetR/AcrR family transcriptional regulator [Chitinophaga costaii]SCC49014.1 transcriptional regulator, TetR family [Chitinophaga costaii]